MNFTDWNRKRKIYRFTFNEGIPMVLMFIVAFNLLKSILVVAVFPYVVTLRDYCCFRANLHVWLI